MWFECLPANVYVVNLNVVQVKNNEMCRKLSENRQPLVLDEKEIVFGICKSSNEISFELGSKSGIQSRFFAELMPSFPYRDVKVQREQTPSTMYEIFPRVELGR